MNTELLSFATLMSLLICTNAIHVKTDEFIDNFQEACYQKREDFSKPLPLFLTKWNNNYRGSASSLLTKDTFKDGPISMSVESLIALIEKIESNPIFKRNNYPAKDLALVLLKKFRADDLEFSNGLFASRPDMETQYKIENVVLGVNENDIQTSDINNILNRDENCTMHFLLSHNIDIVAINGDKSASPYRVQGSPPVNGRGNGDDLIASSYKPRYSVAALPKNTQITKRPREYGVGTFRQNKEQAIALNKVLLGIIAGLSNVQTATVAELYQRTNPDKPLTNDVKIETKSTLEPLMAVTFASVLSYGAFADDQIYQNLFGAEGDWNSTICGIEYNLNVDKDINDVKDIPGVAATMAEIRGAIDGYAIGTALRQINSSPTNGRGKPGQGDLKLSQILKFYYSTSGFEPSTSEFGYCRRPNFRIDQKEITSDAKAFERLSILVSKGPVRIDDTYATGPIEKVKQEFFSKIELAKKIPAQDSDWCSDNEAGSQAVKVDDAQCETPSDVFVMIDQTADEENMQYQRNFIDALAREMDLGKYGSTLTILASSQDSSNPGTLHKIVWEEYNKGCATCRLAFANKDNDFQNFFNFQDFPTLLNDTLRDFELERQYEKAVPSRTFIIMNFKDLAAGRVDVNKFNNGRWLLKNYHRNVRFLVVSDKNEYDYLIEDRNRDFFSRDNGDVQDTVKRVLDRICETPATFQHQECRQKTSQSSEVTQYITPGRVQHWAMYPLHFLKSYRMTFTFKAEKGKLRVCNSRDQKPGFNQNPNYCEENKDKEEITIIRDNPCHKFTRETCAPVYFTVYAVDTSDNNPYCKNENCASLKQIPFTFTHTGVSCNKAFGITFSPMMIILTIISALLIHFKKCEI